MRLPVWQYITFPQAPAKIIAEVEQFCHWGCPWIQLRIKNEPEHVMLKTAFEVASICTKHQTQLIINDDVHIAKQVNADGVHLGKNDLSVAEARKILGKNKIIGATVNTWEDVQQLHQQDIQYIGLGPFAFTKTKEKLSPIIGLEGYRLVVAQQNKIQKKIPIYAVGGITFSDISSIFDTGVYGIAISGMLHHAKDPKAIISLLNQRSYE